MKIEGLVTNTIFRNDDSNYAVISVNTEDGDMVCVGTMPFFNEGENVEITGELVYHEKYGEQLKVNDIKIKKPTDKNSVVKFLTGANIKGIGKKTSEEIYNKFGENSLDIIYYQPDRLLEVEGIGKKKLEDIKVSIDDFVFNKDQLLFLQGLNLSYNLSNKIIEEYGEECEKIIRNNPYQLVEDIKGIGFLMADDIAKNLKIKHDSPFRISAGIIYYLKYRSEFNGDTCINVKTLIVEVSKLLKVDKSQVVEVLEKDTFKDKFVISRIKEENYIYLKHLYDAEKEVAFRLAQLELKECDYDFDFEIEDRYPNFSKEQISAVKKALQNNFLVITGGPGTGKTTIIKAIVELLEKEEYTYYLCAPTGRAAKRMQESTDRSSYTIHRLIGLGKENPDEIYNEDNPLECDYLIVDEVSMVDIFLMNHLLKAITSQTSLILVGDADQLPSVGAGNVLYDLLDAGINHVKLEKIYRQAQQSNITINAHRINKGKYPILNQKGKDFFFIESDYEKIDLVINELISKRLPRFYKLDPIKDIQILSPSKKSNAGVIHLNELLQKTLNKESEFLEINSKIFKKKDKVMQIRNNYDLSFFDSNFNYGEGVFNGDMGYISEIDDENDIIKVNFFDEKIAKYDRENLSDLSLSYAITIHKSQGSEFDCVIIPVTKTPFMLLTRNLLYTAITRAKKLVILVGDKRHLKMMVDNNITSKRSTQLSYRIRESLNELI
ncbi:MAG: ATP-dependent RecD-like DNA helicase [Tissierellia bacterium]|nr:ATP-dependent RecD-like DNA helicase [Tissierellia bacterium]